MNNNVIILIIIFVSMLIIVTYVRVQNSDINKRIKSLEDDYYSNAKK